MLSYIIGVSIFLTDKYTHALFYNHLRDFRVMSVSAEFSYPELTAVRGPQEEPARGAVTHFSCCGIQKNVGQRPAGFTKALGANGWWSESLCLFDS